MNKRLLIRPTLLAAVLLLVPVSPAGARGHNFFAAAASVDLPFSTQDNNYGTGLEPGEPTPCDALGEDVMAATVWYRFELPTSGMVSANTLGSSFDTVLAAHRGETLDSMQEVTCNDDASNTLQSAISFHADAATTYYIQLGGFRGAEGEYAIAIDVLYDGQGPQTTELVTEGDLVVSYGNPVWTSGRLTSPSGPIGGRHVRFEILREGEVMQSAEALTQPNGQARAPLGSGLLPGIYALRTVFAGDDTYQPAERTDRLEIVKAVSQIGTQGPASGFRGQTAVFQPRLLDLLSRPIEGGVLHLTMGSFSDSQVTDVNGRATFQVPLDRDEPGGYELTVAFGGDERYQPSSFTSLFTILWEEVYTDVVDSGRQMLLNPSTKEFKFRATDDETKIKKDPNMQLVPVGDAQLVIVNYEDGDIRLVGQFRRQSTSFRMVARTQRGAYVMTGN